jgi:hypothetical protein
MLRWGDRGGSRCRRKHFAAFPTQKFDRRRTLGNFEYFEASFTEHLQNTLAHVILVFHNQNGATLRWDRVFGDN